MWHTLPLSLTMAAVIFFFAVGFMTLEPLFMCPSPTTLYGWFCRLCKVAALSLWYAYGENWGTHSAAVLNTVCMAEFLYLFLSGPLESPLSPFALLRKKELIKTFGELLSIKF